jgi:peptidyl-prolyl cis-trans isomerase B (cyclophilin B)
VIEGMDVVRKIEGTACDRRDRPVNACVIADCGAL